ncbi:MAG: DUF1499 domain-containing protein [Deltaproteobacteria bacterium]|nr:DUF1499 domain-containing protein [Deltaproteobacteria bacterium]MBW2418713.1 DUF1499 domain-containing protein [Deltaproteobacteria bacterium]
MTEALPGKSSLVAAIASWLGKFAPSCILAGLLGIHLGAIPPLGGFIFYQFGLLIALLALVLGLVGVFLTRGGGDPKGQQGAWLGAASGTLIITLTVIGAGPGIGSPPINDITTDLDDPPAFAPASEVPDYAGRDMGYPAEFVGVVRASYPELGPIRGSMSGEEAYTRALGVAEDLGWEVVHRDPEHGTFDARDTSLFFRFVDDVTVRVRGEGGEAVIDLRSKSRDGRGDLGANAARIEKFKEAFAAAG